MWVSHENLQTQTRGTEEKTDALTDLIFASEGKNEIKTQSDLSEGAYQCIGRDRPYLLQLLLKLDHVYT